jgi:hypothetical protein
MIKLHRYNPLNYYQVDNITFNESKIIHMETITEVIGSDHPVPHTWIEVDGNNCYRVMQTIAEIMELIEEIEMRPTEICERKIAKMKAEGLI